jgi:dsDNA-binding SOS-regulon protein
MAFSTDLAKLLADQLSRFVNLNPHQLAGQVENLDFWLAEVRHALAVIDGYGVRFVRLQAAQERYVALNQITASMVGPVRKTERPPAEAHRVPDRELRQARRQLIQATRRFIERCRRVELISDEVEATALAEFEE